jgi:hypothetical protein
MKRQSIILCCLFSITAQPVAARYINNFGDGLGVNIKTERITEAELNDIARLKFKRVRISITWPNVAGESENAQFSWNNPLDREKTADNYKAEKKYTYDELISKVVNLGLHLDVTLDEGRETPLPIDKIDGFAKFAAATVDHYESNPNYSGAFTWHIWNEPNLSKHPDGSFADTTADAAIFSQVMSKTCLAIRNTKHKAVIMGPALGSNDDNIDYKYIDGLFSDGNNPLECISAFTIHPYRNTPPETVAFDDWEIKNPPLERADYPTVAQHLAPHQPPNTQVPVAVDEIGYDAVSNNANDPARNWRQIVAFAGNLDNNAFFSAYEQAALIFRVYLTNIAEDIPLTVIYDWRDWGNNPKNYQHTWGTVRIPS